MKSVLIETLADECRLVSDAMLELTEDEFEKPTRCPAWNVKELLAHLYRDVEQVAMFISMPPAPSIDCDAVSYWGMYDPVAEAPNLADRAKMRAAAYSSGRQLALVWAWMWPRALEDAAREPDDRVVATWGPGMSLPELLRTRLLELVIHGLDLSDALGRKPWTTAEAADGVRDVLLRRLGGEVPPSLGWDGIAFIEKTTDRDALTDDERAILGEAADRLPLLG